MPTLRGRQRDHRRSSSTQQRRPGRELACQRAGDGRLGDHGIRLLLITSRSTPATGKITKPIEPGFLNTT